MRAVRYPDNPLVGEAAAVVEIARLLRESNEDRWARLETEMRREGLQLREDSTFCQQFIHGQAGSTVDEVVATMFVTAELFAISHIVWSN